MTEKQVATAGMADSHEERHAARFASCVPATSENGPMMKRSKAGIVLVYKSKQNDTMPLRPRVKFLSTPVNPNRAPASPSGQGPKGGREDPSPIVSRSVGAYPSSYEASQERTRVTSLPIHREVSPGAAGPIRRPSDGALRPVTFRATVEDPERTPRHLHGARFEESVHAREESSILYSNDGPSTAVTGPATSACMGAGATAEVTLILPTWRVPSKSFSLIEAVRADLGRETCKVKLPADLWKRMKSAKFEERGSRTGL